MIVLKGRNVNHLLPQGMALLKEQGVKIAPRGLETLEIPCPVASVYENPCERVLFDPIRDANPFFHLMESLWILGGRNDVHWLAQFNRKMANYSDNKRTFHGAYGYRLRYEHNFDQIDEAIHMLIHDQNSRRCVLQIWDAKRDLGTDSADLPCNDLVMLKVRDGKLNITVCNRSNDVIWGCYGANVVQFSMLQEYLAAMINVEVGTYTQVSDSFHVYLDNPYWVNDDFTNSHDPYLFGLVSPRPLIDNPKTFDVELQQFFQYNGINDWSWENSFFPEVAMPMWDAWFAHKYDKSGAIHADRIKATDWKLACLQWLYKRGEE